MSALPASGGVRSLLAKFENTNNNSSNNGADVSPSRGRSSFESNDNAANRPLSKVRASFVSVERNGQGSPTPGMLRRTESYGTDADSSQRSATMSPIEKSLASPFSPSPQKIRTALAAFQGGPVKSVNEKLASLAVDDKESPQPSTATKESGTIQEPSPVVAVDKPSNKPAHGVPKKQPPSMTIKKSASTMSIPKEPSTSKTTINKTAAKERKPAVTPTRSATTTIRPTAHADKPTTTTKRAAAAKSTVPAARPDRSKTPSQDPIKKPTIQPSPQSKPASKSPTRPVRLPASLVTPTAASTARTGSLARSQSHINLRSSPKTETAKTLSRKPSTLRPDAARLSTHIIPDRPRSRMSTTSSRAPQEESFLARMMRPTASSASKMHDKVEPRSPPRLAKAAKLSPKKEQPAKVVEDKSEKHEQSPQEPSPTPVAVEEKVEQPIVPKLPVEKAVASTDSGHIEKPAAPALAPEVEDPKSEAKVYLEQPSSEPHELEVVPEVEAEPASESTVVDVEPQAPEVTEEPLPETTVAEVKSEDVQNQSAQNNNVNHTGEKEPASAPETVPEEPESNTQEAAQEADLQHEKKEDDIEEPAAEVDAPQEEGQVQQPVEEPPKDEEVKSSESALHQPSEESITDVPGVSEEALAETSGESATVSG
ncbi:hypothetical protein UA08_08146 [Talaromyces atroroseus]|uniref:Mucin-7 n=1 Tax=Talaromyces atroroseus TaxID=1441469 RepID=A0A225ANT2_TALAT|nr:hypothetical protein UA08_08146 [Talaromyces atroroseus]OKL56616.1 hypothetical protein UA08_08146 [Talaromyces atroroseus]